MTGGLQEMVTLPFARQLAAWATLKIMASEHLMKSDKEYAQFFTQDQGSFLRKKTKPPESVHIWIGQYVGTNRRAGWVLSRQSARPLPEDETVGAFRHAATFSIGQVAFQLFGVRLFPLTEDQDRRPIEFYNPFSFVGPWAEALVSIWPLPESMFRWPPDQALDDSAFEASAMRWHQQQPAGRPKHHRSPKSRRRR